MSVRSKAQPLIDEFIQTLEEFATGAYLQEDEREFWEEPFEPSALTELRGILESFAADLDGLGSADAAAVDTRLAALEQSLSEFNSRHYDAVIEPEEHEELNQLIATILQHLGVERSELSAFPLFYEDAE